MLAAEPNALIVFLPISFGSFMADRVMFVLIMGIMLAVLLSYASASTGVENITLSQYAINASPGQNLNVNFSLKLVSGYDTFGTTFWVYNAADLGSQNITLILSPNYGSPPINGVMHIFIGHTAAPGVYDISLRGNSSNLRINPAMLVLDIPSSTTTAAPTTSAPGSSYATTSASTSVSASTTVSAQASSAPSTVQQTTAASTVQSSSAKSGSGGLSYYMLVMVLILVAVIAFLVGKGMSSGGKKPESQSHSAPHQNK